MAIDWSLYGALQGQNNWQQRRADKMMNMQIVQQQAQDEENRVKESMAAEEYYNKYLDELRNMDVLEQDKDRVQQVERDARSKVINGIKRYNGDLRRFMNSGGITEMHNYKNSVMESDAVKNAMSNKANLKAFLEAKNEGMFVYDVNVPEPVLGEDGQPKLDPATGKPVYKNRRMSFEDQFTLFKNGKIDKLEFRGATPSVKLNPFMFLDRPKDPKNPYSDDNIVTASNVKFLAMQMAAPEEYADHLAREYVAMVNAGGDSWKWGNKSKLEGELMQAQIDAYKAKAAAAGRSSGGGQTVLNQLAPALQRLGQSGNPSQMAMENKEKDYWQNYLGLNYDNNSNRWKPTQSLTGIDAHTGAKYDLGNALSITPNSYVAQKDKDGVMQKYILANVAYDGDNPGANNPHTESMGLFNKLKDTATKNNWREMKPSDINLNMEDVSDIWYGKVMIPITKAINTPTFKDGLNTFLNRRSNLEGAAGSATDLDYQRNAGMDISAISQMAERNGITLEQALYDIYGQVPIQ